MKLYREKKRWKWFLFVSAIFIFTFFILYSNRLINDIVAEERRKISVWADAVTYRAQLVTHTQEFFENIKEAERGRAELLAQAIMKIQQANFDEDITFYTNVITSNSSIPSIITDEHGNIITVVNVDSTLSKLSNVREMGERIFDFYSLNIKFYGNRYNTVYYSESLIFTDLKEVLDKLIQSYFSEVVINLTSVPVIITNEDREQVIAFGRTDATELRNDLPTVLARMEAENPPIAIQLPDIGKCYVFYEDSSMLKQLRYFPFIQFSVIIVFIIIGYLIFSFARKSEQNQVWVGMSKETAHQLGTPISSLFAWNEILKSELPDQTVPEEIHKDLERLEMIAQRFSKIGSVPEIVPENITKILEKFLSYIRTRVTTKVEIKFNTNHLSPILPVNKYLLEWVIENLCKNAIDAIDGYGVILIDLTEDEKHIFIDISDTGKGIPLKMQKAIFQPGFTLKKRGWGLGLTLAKRIVEQYHDGRLFVLNSTMGKGTTMRIELHKEVHKKLFTS